MNTPTFVAATIFLVTSGAARADVLFNNFGPGDSYLGNTGWTVINGGPVGAHIEEASSFTVSGGDFFFTTAEFGAGHLFGPNVLIVTLHDDAAGVPGDPIESVTLVDQLLRFPNKPQTNYPPVVAPFSGGTVLRDGSTYWLSMSTVTDTDAWAAWNYNITGDLGLRAFREDSGPWSPHTGDPRGVFRVNGAPVPSPATLALPVALALRAARRRR